MSCRINAAIHRADLMLCCEGSKLYSAESMLYCAVLMLTMLDRCIGPWLTLYHIQDRRYVMQDQCCYTP